MYTLGKTVVVHRDRFAYISHPSIVVLDNGEWLAAFNHSRRRERRLHPPSDPLYRTLVARSGDQGRSWQMPVFSPDFDWYGTECPGIAQTSGGTVLLSQFRFAWYPLALAKQRRIQGELISIALPDIHWTEDFTDADWDRALLPWARGYHGLYVHRSIDGGASYTESVKIDTTPYRDGYTRTGIHELSDGRLVYIVTEHHPPSNRYTYVLFSEDEGKTWNAPVVVVDDPGLQFSEPDIAEVAPGNLICVLRDSKKTGYLHTCRSTDAGVTWTAPEKTPLYGHPGQLLMLVDGRLLCTYGRRVAPFGIRASLSEDGGRTWRVEQEIVIRDDLPNADLGYPTTVEYEPGKLFCIYYGQDENGITHVMGTYVWLSF